MVQLFKETDLSALQTEFPGLSEGILKSLMPSILAAMRDCRDGDRWNDEDFEFWLKKVYTPMMTEVIGDLTK